MRVVVLWMNIADIFAYLTLEMHLCPSFFQPSIHAHISSDKLDLVVRSQTFVEI